MFDAHTGHYYLFSDCDSSFHCCFTAKQRWKNKGNQVNASSYFFICPTLNLFPFLLCTERGSEWPVAMCGK